MSNNAPIYIGLELDEEDANYPVFLNSSLKISGSLNLANTQDADSSADNGPALIVGPRNGIHLEIDQNEIIAKSTATTGGTLTIGDPTSGDTYIRGISTYMVPSSSGFYILMANSVLIQQIQHCGLVHGI